MVKKPAVNARDVRSLGQEDPLEKGMATYCSNLAWSIPWTEEPVWGESAHRIHHINRLIESKSFVMSDVRI